ncbi:MAG TPA: hypothetical protein DEG44_01630 [Candidatus Kerfeldbacteria bacterium]|nr:hypothetical protein [Candidatus Kerfeldbacteria bacterium]
MFFPFLTLAVTEIELSELAYAETAVASQEATEALANVGDINGDGYEDVAIGAPSANAVYLLYGQSGRFDEEAIDALPAFQGEDDGDQLGSAIAGVGDVNADGYDDFVMTSIYHDTSVTNPGTVYLIYGQATHFTTQTVENRPRWSGETKNDHAGVSVAWAGDLNTDGFDDIAIGATWHNDRSGGVYLVYGQATAFTGEYDLADQPLLAGTDDYDYAGTAMVAGDVTGDGLTDLVVSATKHDDGERDVGAVYTVPGKTSQYVSTSLDAFNAIVGSTKRERIGSSLAIVGGDIYIGAPYNDSAGDNAGVVYINSTATKLSGAAAGDLFGKSLATFGDGVLIGAPSELDPQAGSVWVHTTTGDTALLGEVAGDQAGYTVATADVDGDGQAELLIGAPDYGPSSGRLYIGYWPIYTCDNSAALGGILANYPTADYKHRKYAKNKKMRIVVERRGQQAFLINCNANKIQQTLTFNTRVQRKILARVFSARNVKLFIVVTRTPSKRKIKVFLYKQTKTQLLETDQFTRKWRPRGLRIKIKRRNRVVLQKGAELKHRLRYSVSRTLTLNELD